MKNKTLSGIQFVKRIDLLLAQRNSDRLTLCKEVSIPPSTLATWKSKDCLPPAETIVKIAKTLNVSTDFLLTGNFFKPDNSEINNIDENFIITELEFIKSHLELLTEELKKGNAELKEKLNIRSCQNCRKYNRTCPNDGSCKNYSKWEGYKNPQLTKAKELLAKWVELFKPKNETALPTPIQVDTEQFLSDMEK